MEEALHTEGLIVRSKTKLHQRSHHLVQNFFRDRSQVLVVAPPGNRPGRVAMPGEICRGDGKLRHLLAPRSENLVLN